jgi:pyruvate kinase
VANAIIDGTDAVMLSGETANGGFPVESVLMMARIAEVAEASGRHGNHLALPLALVRNQRDLAHAMSAAACAVVNGLDVQAIVAFTMSGVTARLVSRLRPTAAIVAFTPSEQTYRRLNLIWGVTPILCEYVSRLDDLGTLVNQIMVERSLGNPGDLVVMTGGHPIATRGPTNFVKVLELVE